MAKPLVLRVGGVELPFALSKVDRSEFYGYVDVETLDARGRRCSTATLADDGRTVVGPGGTAFACVSPDGRMM